MRIAQQSVQYRSEWERSMAEPDGFWLDQAVAIDWVRPPATGNASSGIDPRWFADGILNVSFNALDRHVAAGRGDQVALVHDSAMTGSKVHITFSELRDRVARFAGALVALGVTKGDRVLIYMPMIPEAAVAMLACARIGAPHCVVFGGFAARELAVRIDDVQPKVIVTASGGLEPARVVEYTPLVEQAVGESSAGVSSVVVWQRDEIPVDLVPFSERSTADWFDWKGIESAATPADAVPVEAGHPLYVLHTSGTTGNPKGVVRDSGGYAVALSWAMKNIFGVNAGDTMFTASDVGWVVGHSFIVYGPLLAGATTIMYEGKPVGTPDPSAFWRVVAEHRADVMFTAPTALRAIRREDPDLCGLDGLDIGTLRALFVAGERVDPETWHWIGDRLGVPVIDNWWQTETGWPICANPIGFQSLPDKVGSTTVPMPGFDVRVLDPEEPEYAGAHSLGTLAIALPLPPGSLTGIWGSRQRFHDSYFTSHPGYYVTGDTGYIDEDGYVFVMGRYDDVINVAGHRLSAGALEEVLTQHDAVAECAVIGARDDLKGQRPVGLVTLKASSEIDASLLTQELIKLVRDQIGPVAAFKDVVVVERLPKTRSGKTLRRNLRQIVDGVAVTAPATIEDISVLNDVVKRIERSHHWADD